MLRGAHKHLLMACQYTVGVLFLSLIVPQHTYEQDFGWFMHSLVPRPAPFSVVTEHGVGLGNKPSSCTPEYLIGVVGGYRQVEGAKVLPLLTGCSEAVLLK